MQHCEPGELIYPQPVTVNPRMPVAKYKRRLRGVGCCLPNGVGSQNSSLERVQYTLTCKWLNNMGRITNINQVPVSRLKGGPRQRADRQPLVAGLKSELFCGFLSEPVGVLGPAHQTQVSEVFSHRGQTEVTVWMQLQCHVRLGVAQKVSLQTNTISGRFGVIGQEPGHRRIAAVRCDEEAGLHGFAASGDLPGRPVPNLHHRFSESDLGS